MTTLDTRLAEAIDRYATANPTSREQYEQAERYLPGGVTREVLRFKPFPLTVRRASGASVCDIDGHEYIDFVNEYTANFYGHTSRPVADAIRAAVTEGLLFGGLTTVEARLAEAIVGRFPVLEKVRFCNSGTEANLLACSLARAVTGRDRILVFHGAYHGGFLNFAHGLAPLNAPYPFLVCDYNGATQLDRLLREHGHTLAAVLLEPMLGPGGCIPGTSEFLKAAEKAKDLGALLIVDEVMTSRLAPGGLHRAAGIEPDLMTLGKYIGGGLPFGVLGGSKAVMAHLDGEHGLEHHGTFNNNILTLTAALAGIQHVYTEEAVVATNARGDALRERLNESVRRHKVSAFVAGKGSMMAVHFADPPVKSAADVERGSAKKQELLRFWMLDHGCYLLKLGMIVLSLETSDDDCNKLAKTFDEFLARNADVI